MRQRDGVAGPRQVSVRQHDGVVGPREVSVRQHEGAAGPDEVSARQHDVEDYHDKLAVILFKLAVILMKVGVWRVERAARHAKPVVGRVRSWAFGADLEVPRAGLRWRRTALASSRVELRSRGLTFGSRDLERCSRDLEGDAPGVEVGDRDPELPSNHGKVDEKVLNVGFGVSKLQERAASEARVSAGPLGEGVSVRWASAGSVRLADQAPPRRCNLDSRRACSSCRRATAR